MSGSRITNLIIILGLVIGTFALYGRVGRYDFVNFDDSIYVYENPRVLNGLTPDNFLWAMSASVCSNWHPVTMLSYLLDVQIAGKNPHWMHLENVSFHAANSAILFLVLFQLTAARWPSAWVAAMFAWHPLHVESVAWISERKDVLSTLFMLLCIGAYVRWVRQQAKEVHLRCDRFTRRGVVSWGYALVLGLLVLGLMSKPMVVTLPFVLLLLDVWPLKRLASWRDAWARVVEKWPMFICVLAGAIITYFVQSAGRSVAPVAKLSLGLRIANSLIAYGKYLSLTFVPRHLAIFYPLATTYPGGKISIPAAVVSAAVLAAITVIALLFRRRQPAMLIGWLWFLGTLVPVIGLVQVGSQAYADRYMYIPSIGIFIAIAFPLCALVANRKVLRGILIALAFASIVAIVPVTWRQIGTWRNSITVMQHAADVVPNNYVAFVNLGEAYDTRGDPETAAKFYQQTLQICPGDATALNNLAIQAAARHDDQTAIRLYRASVFSDPTYAPAYNNYGNVLERMGRHNDAITVYREGMKRDPDFAQIRHNLALALAETGQLDEAIDLWHQALRINPNYADAHESLGEALVLKGQMDEGIRQLRDALRINPNRVTALKSLAWILATDPNQLYQNGPEAEQMAARAAQLAPGDPAVLDVLAAAYAREGNFDQAIEQAQKAAALAKQQNQSDFAKQILARCDLYKSHQPFTSGK